MCKESDFTVKREMSLVPTISMCKRGRSTTREYGRLLLTVNRTANSTDRKEQMNGKRYKK
jgi:hypothetical protein